MLSYLSPLVRLYILALTGLTGLVLGSALHCLAYRLVHNEKWKGGRSHCPACGHVLGPADLVPVFSYVFLRGRCRYCREKISPRYLMAELTLGMVFVSTVVRYDLSLETIQYLILCSCLFSLSLVDLDSQEIPDRFLLIAAGARVLYLAAAWGLSAGMLGQLWYCLWHGLLLGGCVLALSLFMDKVLQKESMGGGDIKLLFVLGLYFDLPCCFLLVILACVLGIVLAMTLGAKKNIPFPFGPALSLAAWVTLLVGPQLTGWYLGLF